MNLLFINTTDKPISVKSGLEVIQPGKRSFCPKKRVCKYGYNKKGLVTGPIGLIEKIELDIKNKKSISKKKVESVKVESAKVEKEDVSKPAAKTKPKVEIAKEKVIQKKNSSKSGAKKTPKKS